MRDFALTLAVCVGGVTAFCAFLIYDHHSTGRGAHIIGPLYLIVGVGSLITFLALALFKATPKKKTDVW